jgi:hypothetical protein
MKIRWPVVLFTCVAISFSIAGSSLAFPSKRPINTNWQGIAVKGYDPVAYFTKGQPMKGKKKFEFEWNGAKWRFADAEHLDLFKSDPEKYAPQYGGY